MKRSEALRIEARAMRDAAELASEVYGLGTTEPVVPGIGATDKDSFRRGCVVGVILSAEDAEEPTEKAEAEGD